MSTETSPLDSLPLGKRELICLLALLMSLNALGIDAMLPALEDMARELGAGDGNRRQLVIASFTLAMGLGCLLPGSFADRFGRRPVILISLAAYSVLSLVTALLQDFETLLVIRAITGLSVAALMVVPVAIVRDLYDGDNMAKLMSIIAAVFITVPVIAPSIGQAILFVAGWRWIFTLLGWLAVITAVWVWFRLPETLAPEKRQKIRLPTVVRNMGLGLANRASIGYVLGSSLVMAGVFGYVNSAAQLYHEVFDVGDNFPIMFGATAAMMAFSNIVNSRIVTKFGARRVSHAGVLIFIIVSAIQVWSTYAHPGNLYWFLPLMSINFGLLGFLGANFGSIAMQPFAHIAGAASSVQTFVRMFGAAVIGGLIGQLYNGTAIPFAWALFLTSSLAFLLVLYSEKGVLFRRLHKKPPNDPPVP